MAKRDMMMSGGCGPKCIVLGLIAAAFFAAGLWTLVSGFQMQSAGMTMGRTFLWYFGGFILWCIGKCVKRKSCGMCAMN